MKDADIQLLHQNVYAVPKERTIGQCVKLHTNITVFALIGELEGLRMVVKGNAGISNVVEMRIRELKKLVKPMKINKPQ